MYFSRTYTYMFPMSLTLHNMSSFQSIFLCLFHILYFPSSRLKKLLHQVEVDFEETCYLTEGVDQCQPTYSNIPWTDVISICIDYKLATLDVMDPNINTQVRES